MAVKTRREFLRSRRASTRLQEPLRAPVSQITGFVVQPNKAVVGANAFAQRLRHPSDGVLGARHLTRSCAPRSGWSTNRIVRWAALRAQSVPASASSSFGIELESQVQVNEAFAKFATRADKKADIFDEDIQMLSPTITIPPSTTS